MDYCRPMTQTSKMQLLTFGHYSEVAAVVVYIVCAVAHVDSPGLFLEVSLAVFRLVPLVPGEPADPVLLLLLKGRIRHLQFLEVHLQSGFYKNIERNQEYFIRHQRINKENHSLKNPYSYVICNDI